MKKHSFKNIFYFNILLLFGACHAINAQTTAIEIEQGIDSVLNIATFTTVFVDKSATLDLESIKEKNKTGAFIPLENLVLEGKYTRSKYNYWLHFRLTNKQFLRSILTYKCGFHEKIDFYQVYDTDVIQYQIAGNGRIIRQQDRLFPNKYSIKFEIDSLSSYDFYIKINNELSFTKPISVLSNEVFELESNYHQLFYYHLFYTSFFVFLIFTSVFTFTQYTLNKELPFLYYTLHTLATLVLYYKLFDISNPVIQNLPPTLGSYLYLTFFSFLPPIPTLLFAMSLFKTKEQYPHAHKVIKTALTSILVFLILDKVIWYFDKDLAWQISDFIRVFFFFVILYPIYQLLKSKNKLAKYIVSGLLIVALCTILNMIFRMTQAVDNPGYWDLPLVIQFAGIIVSYIFFWLALGHNSQQTQIEKNTIQQNLEIEKQEKIFERKTNKLRNTFFTNITHEFRTPLTIINGLSAELKENTEKNIQQKATFIHRNGAKMLLLVNQLLSLSKLDAGKLTIHYQQANIIPFLNYLLNSFQSLAHSKNISLVLNNETKQVIMDYDPEKMQTILSNLLSNAIKFTPKNGQIIIHIEQKLIQKEQLIISIKDNGIGIHEKSLPYIFDRFHQEQGQHKNTGEGSGIGLALVKELVDLLGAKIIVKSTLNIGSEFLLLFPINRNAPLQTPDSIQAKEPILLEVNPYISIRKNKKEATNQPSILIVEDNPDVRFFITSCLKNNYQVLEAADGQQGIDCAIKESPDLVISDVMMPRKNGFELCATIKNHERTDHIPIILLTAKATQDDKNKGLLQGADAYLIKPFNKKELLIRVEKLLENRKKLLSRFQQFAGIESATQSKSPVSTPFLLEIDAILEQKYTDELFNTQLLCKALGKSKTLMYESIKNEAGLSPGLYIRAFRLRKAKKHLLKNKSLTIREVAYSVGFKSPVYFSQEFKKAFGCSAGEFRRKNQ